jgi:hypothetical protein
MRPFVSPLVASLGLLAACAGSVPPASPPPVAALSASVVATTPPGSPAPRALAETSGASEVSVVAGDFVVTVRATPVGNLTYQLDCLADVIHCSTEAFRSFWKPTWTPSDDAALAAWRSVRERYAVSATLAGEVPRTAVTLPYGQVEVDKAVRIAGLLAHTEDELRANLRPVLPPQDAERLTSALAHFRPRFDAWWTTKGQVEASRFARDLAPLFEREDVAGIVTRAARFYGSPLPKGTPIDFDLVPLPGEAKWTSGEQMLSHGVIEVLPGEKPNERMDVVCHELFHFFYASRTTEAQAALANRFTSSSDPLAVIAYFLLDESVATALGNGVVDRAANPPDYAKRLARDLGFYGVHSIDATAKGLLARTHGDPTAGPPLDSPEAVATLIDAAREAIGDDPPPLQYLHAYAGAAEPGWWDAVMQGPERRAPTNDSHHASPIDAADAVAMVRDHAAMSFVLIAPRARLGALTGYGDAVPKDARRAIAAEAKRSGAFAYVWSRTPQARAFVIVAESKEEAKGVAEALFAEGKAVEGVYRASASVLRAPR